MSKAKSTQKSHPLRRKAEELAAKKRPDIKKMISPDVEKLVHDLQVHQIELEMQNETLRKAQVEIEESRSKYSDLYDFAPIGYFTHDRNGLILESNLTLASLLESDRPLMIKRPFQSFVDPPFQDRLSLHLAKVRKTGLRERCELRLKNKSGKLFFVSLETVSVKDSSGKIQYRSAVSDITGIKIAEEELRRSHDELEKRVREATGQLAQANRSLQDEVEKTSRQNVILGGINRIFQAALTCSTEKELGQACLKVAEDISQSQFGFIGEISSDGFLRCLSMSDAARNLCAMSKEMEHLQPAAGFPITGLYGSVLQRGKGIFTNEPSEHPDRLGTPAGHPPLSSFLGVPLVRDQKTIGVLALGNRKGGYTQVELEAMESTAPFIVEALSRKQAEEALRASEVRLNRSQEIARLGSWELDLLKNELTWSDEVYRIFGLRPQEFGATYGAFLERVHPEDRADVDEAYSGSLRERKMSYEIEHRVVRKDTGEVRWVTEKCEHETDSAGRIIRSLGMVQDITERKQADEALRKSEGRYHSLFENMLDGFAYCEMLYNDQGQPIDFVYLEVNNAFESLTGLKNVIGKKVTEVIPGIRETHPEVFEIYGRVALTGRPETFEINFTILGIWLSVSVYSPQKNHFIAVFENITERKRGEEDLRRSRDELELRVQERTAELKEKADLLDLTHDAIVVRKMSGEVTFWNGGAREMYGWTREEALGKIGRDLLKTEFPAPREDLIAKLIKDGRWEGEVAHTRKDGRKIKVFSRWSLQRDENGKPAAVMIISHDITERLKIEEQIRQIQKMEALGTLAGGIAHDFNNLLQPILLNTEMALLDIGEGNIPSPESIKLAMGAAKRAQELVKQIITFSRHKEQVRNPVEIRGLMEETLNFLRSAIPKTIEIRGRIEFESAVVLADPTQIHQVMMNLCANAAHAMRDRGGVLEIAVTRVEMHGDIPSFRGGLKPGPYIRLTVKDNGHGMTPEVRERAFDPFFTTKNQGEGTGLGLAVVHGIVKRHEGAITIESEVEKGTTVNVFLPLFQEGQGEDFPILAAVPRGTERILLVDDEDSLLSSVGNMLDRLGYQVNRQKDARQALEIFRSTPELFDLVITDQTMPYLTGDQLARKLLSIRPDIPVILCTGFSERVDIEEAKAAGIRDFVLKPFTIQEMANMIRRALRKDES